MSEKRLPQVGEVWWDKEGELNGPLTPQTGSAFVFVADRRSYTKNGDFWSVSGPSMRDLILIHSDSTGKIINPTFNGSEPMVPDPTPKAKPPKPDPLAQAIAESRERTKGLEDLQAKLSRQAKDKAEAKALAAEIAALRAKYPIEPKAAKAGRKGK